MGQIMRKEIFQNTLISSFFHFTNIPKIKASTASIESSVLS